MPSLGMHKAVKFAASLSAESICQLRINCSTCVSAGGGEEGAGKGIGRGEKKDCVGSI